MLYQKHGWVDYELADDNSNNPRLSAKNLNEMEEGIYESHERLNKIESDIKEIKYMIGRMMMDRTNPIESSKLEKIPDYWKKYLII